MALGEGEGWGAGKGPVLGLKWRGPREGIRREERICPSRPPSGTCKVQLAATKGLVRDSMELRQDSLGVRARKKEWAS